MPIRDWVAEHVSELAAPIRGFVVLRAVWGSRQFKNHSAILKQQVLLGVPPTRKATHPRPKRRHRRIHKNRTHPHKAKQKPKPGGGGHTGGAADQAPKLHQPKIPQQGTPTPQEQRKETKRDPGARFCLIVSLHAPLPAKGRPLPGHCPPRAALTARQCPNRCFSWV
jgi:hypothetical protein